jgi:hypothetical protein
MKHIGKILLAAALVDQTGRRARKTMKPYKDKLDTPDGVLALTLITGVQQQCEKGLCSLRQLSMAVKKASVMSGIPDRVFLQYISFTNAVFLLAQEDEKFRAERQCSHQHLTDAFLNNRNVLEVI